MRPLLLVRSITVSAGFNVFNFSSMLNLSVLLSILMNLGLNNNSDICRRCKGETWRIEADLSLRGSGKKYENERGKSRLQNWDPF